jgi:hypothetical protein
VSRPHVTTWSAHATDPPERSHTAVCRVRLTPSPSPTALREGTQTQSKPSTVKCLIYISTLTFSGKRKRFRICQSNNQAEAGYNSGAMCFKWKQHHPSGRIIRNTETKNMPAILAHDQNRRHQAKAEQTKELFQKPKFGRTQGRLSSTRVKLLSETSIWLTECLTHQISLKPTFVQEDMGQRVVVPQLEALQKTSKNAASLLSLRLHNSGSLIIPL